MLLASMSIDRTIAITIKQAKKFSTPQTAHKVCVFNFCFFLDKFQLFKTGLGFLCDCIFFVCSKHAFFGIYSSY